jgi:hypothetical protein
MTEDIMSCPFDTFTDAEITARLSVPMIIDAFWENEYNVEVPPITREVGCALMFLVRKYGPVIPHDVLVRAVAEHTEVSESTVLPFVKNAVSINMISAVKPEQDGRLLLYGFLGDQKKKILRASNAPAYAASLAIEQARDPANTEFGKTPQNASYYRHIFTRINLRNEAIMNKIEKLRRRIAWIIMMGTVVAIALQPWTEAAASWSNGKT